MTLTSTPAMHGRFNAPRRRGVAMILAMGAVAVVFVVGLSLLSGLPATAGASQNLARRDAAICLAESGLAEGVYWLQNPPEDVDVWPGVAGRTLPGVDGSYDVAITQPESFEDDEYLIAATGHVNKSDGSVLSHVVTLKVRLDQGDSGPGVTMEHTALFGGGTSVPRDATIDGDVHVNGFFFNWGTVNGHMSSSLIALSIGSTTGGRPTSFADPVELPDVDLDLYTQYEYNGRNYQAQVVTPNEAADLGSSNPATADNPLGVIVVEGDMTLDSDVQINDGILVVKGDLSLAGHRLDVSGRPGHMSLLVERDVNMTNSSLRMPQGTAYVGRQLDSNGSAHNLNLELEGGLICAEGRFDKFNGNFHIRFPDIESNGSAHVQYMGGNAGGGGGGERSVTPLAYTGVNQTY